MKKCKIAEQVGPLDLAPETRHSRGRRERAVFPAHVRQDPHYSRGREDSEHSSRQTFGTETGRFRTEQGWTGLFCLNFFENFEKAHFF